MTTKTVARYWVLRDQPTGWAAVKISGVDRDDWDFEPFNPKRIDERYEEVNWLGYVGYRFVHKLNEVVGRLRALLRGGS